MLVRVATSTCRFSADGSNALGGPGGSLSHTGERFLAGLVGFAGDFTALHAPYANSYRRLRPGSWAPVNATWGFDNRTCLVRVVGSGSRPPLRVPPSRRRCQSVPGVSGVARLRRLQGLTGNSGRRHLWRETPTKPTLRELPADLTEAVQRFGDSETARTAFGPRVHAHLLAMVRNERDEARAAVTDWDLQRGFENA